MTDELIGSALLHYVVVRKIGEGGMGAVYLAHETTPPAARRHQDSSDEFHSGTARAFHPRGARASLSGDEPVDVANYAKAHPEFPNGSTADQWFTEAQFESYRALGQHMVDSLVAQRDAERIALSIEEFFDAASGRAAASVRAVSV